MERTASSTGATPHIGDAEAQSGGQAARGGGMNIQAGGSVYFGTPPPAATISVAKPGGLSVPRWFPELLMLFGSAVVGAVLGLSETVNVRPDLGVSVLSVAWILVVVGTMVESFRRGLADRAVMVSGALVAVLLPLGFVTSAVKVPILVAGLALFCTALVDLWTKR